MNVDNMKHYFCTCYSDVCC